MPIRRVLCCVLLLTPVGSVAAQRAPAVTLKPATAKLDEEFTSITGIRELKDRRVLITDERAKRVVVADFSASGVLRVGRVGEGPGEYRFARAVFATSGDSGVMPQGMNWLLLDGDRIVGALTPESPVIRGMGMATVFGTDAIGFVYTRIARQVQRGETVREDSVLVARVARATGRSDTVAHLRTSPLRLIAAVLEGGATAQRWTPSPLPLEDDAIPFADGWLAIARAEPYRVDWQTSDGRTITGAPLPVTLANVAERDRQAITDSFPRKPGRMPEFDFSAFPARVPPFQRAALVAASDGRLLIRRTPTASEAITRYDIVDRQSRLVGQLTMPKNERIVGVGSGALYVAVVDGDGIQRVRRHPWP